MAYTMYYMRSIDNIKTDGLDVVHVLCLYEIVWLWKQFMS